MSRDRTAVRSFFVTIFSVHLIYMSNHSEKICRQCGTHGADKFCSHCGQAYSVKKITLTGILHEVFHFFSHLEKGFPYTLTKIVTQPGQMQREYIEGQRVKHQKPFSMYFLCATIAALLYYWINLALIKYFHTPSNEVTFFHQYMVVLQIVMLPVYSFITWLFFRNSKYNFAETMVLLLYTFSFVLLLAACIQLLKFIWPGLQTRYIELPLIMIYITITNVRFFHDIPKWIAFVKSIVVTVLCFGVVTFIQDWLVTLIH